MSAAFGSVRELYESLQEHICKALEDADGRGRFRTDDWNSDLGCGSTRVMEGGALLEKGGVNFSRIKGERLPAAASGKRPDLAERPFAACGLSIVLHPQNPFVPASHCNVRFFEVQGGPWWFGGGFDLSPCYGFDEDCVLWHRAAHRACASTIGASFYAPFKHRCDEYFHLRHRGECRGIGGLFFDDLAQGNVADCLAFARAVGLEYLGAVLAIAQRRRSTPFDESHKEFQRLRRGRYAEFNLLWDRGTLFGLQSGGRSESILVSLPPQAAWRYDWKPPPGSREAALDAYLQPRDWLQEGGE